MVYTLIIVYKKQTITFNRFKMPKTDIKSVMFPVLWFVWKLFKKNLIWQKHMSVLMK